MIVNQQNMRGLDIGYNTAFNKSFEETETTYQRIATEVPSSTSANDYKWLGQFPGMREWIGEREVQNIAGYSYVLENKHFEETIAVPRDAVEDDQYGVYTPMFSRLGQTVKSHPDELVYECAKKGFEELCYDGKPFFSDEHRVGYGKVSNMSEMPLSMKSYIQGRTAIMNMKGDNGKSLKLVPDLLVVAPNNEEMGRKILKAEFDGGTSNVYKDTAELLVVPDLADFPNMWMLLCTRGFLKPFLFQKRKEIKLVSFMKETDESVFRRNQFEWGADGCSNAGYSFWQMAYGSTGEAKG